MHRSLSRARLRSLTDSFYKFQERKNVVERAEFSLMSTSSEGYCHLGLREKSVTRAVQVQIVDALRLGERDRAFQMLSNLDHGNFVLRACHFDDILEYCARSPDPLFAMETWRVMEEKEIDMNKRSCMSIIQALCKGGYLDQAFEWLKFSGGNFHTNQGLLMYNIFLNQCAGMRSLVHADYCLELMDDRMIGKSETTYCELLKLAVLQKNLSAAHEIWKECMKYYSPSIICLRKFIWSFTRLRDLGSAYDALQHMVALAFQGSASFTTSSEGRYKSSRLDVPILSVGDSHIKRCGMVESGCSLPSVYGENSVKIREGIGDNRVDGFSRKKQALYGIEENVNPGVLSESMPHVPNATEFIFSGTVGSSAAAMVENNCRSVQLLPPIPHASETGNQQTDFGTASIKLEGSGSIMQNAVSTKPVMKVLRWSFSDVIHACAQSRKYELAEQLFLQMHNLGLEPSQHTYDGFVKAVVCERGVIYGMEVVKAMEKRNMKPYTATLATLSIGYSRILELDLAEALLDQVVESQRRCNIHPFNAFLAACDVMDEPERAVRVLAKMKRLKLKSDIRTYEMLFSLFGYVNAPYEKGNMLSKAEAENRIHAIEMDMAKNGVQHSRVSVKNLLKALGAEGMIREMIQYLQVAEYQLGRSNTYPGTAMYNTVLHELVEAKESHNAIEVFKNMKSCELPPDAATYNIMIDCCSIIRCFKSACALVSMMLRDGFCPQTCTYTALIKILLANDDFDEALNLLYQVTSEGLQPDVILFNSFLKAAYLKGRIDIIELIIEQMHRKKIQPDPPTSCYVFSAYVDCGFLNTAVEALQVLSMRMISEEETTLQEKKADLEDLILDEDPAAELRIIEIFKDSNEHLAAALLNLRWCAIAGFTISWLPSENVWARRLSSS